MPKAKLTTVQKADGSIRRVVQTFYDGDPLTPVKLEEGERIIKVFEASTALERIGSSENQTPLPEDLKAELLAMIDVVERGDFVDISHKIR